MCMNLSASIWVTVRIIVSVSLIVEVQGYYCVSYNSKDKNYGLKLSRGCRKICGTSTELILLADNSRAAQLVHLE